jgi:hypothetical protein
MTGTLSVSHWNTKPNFTSGTEGTGFPCPLPPVVTFE